MWKLGEKEHVRMISKSRHIFRLRPHYPHSIPPITNRDIGADPAVYPVHVFMKLGSVSIPIPVVVCYKQIRMDHFVKECLH